MICVSAFNYTNTSHMAPIGDLPHDVVVDITRRMSAASLADLRLTSSSPVQQPTSTFVDRLRIPLDQLSLLQQTSRWNRFDQMTAIVRLHLVCNDGFDSFVSRGGPDGPVLCLSAKGNDAAQRHEVDQALLLMTRCVQMMLSVASIELDGLTLATINAIAGCLTLGACPVFTDLCLKGIAFDEEDAGRLDTMWALLAGITGLSRLELRLCNILRDGHFGELPRLKCLKLAGLSSANGLPLSISVAGLFGRVEVRHTLADDHVR